MRSMAGSNAGFAAQTTGTLPRRPKLELSNHRAAQDRRRRQQRAARTPKARSQHHKYLGGLHFAAVAFVESKERTALSEPLKSRANSRAASPTAVPFRRASANKPTELLSPMRPNRKRANVDPRQARVYQGHRLLKPWN